MKLIVETIGWLAAITMLSAYILLTLGRIDGGSRFYHWLNVVSGAGIILNSSWNGAYPSVFLNVVWVAVGLYGVFGRALAK